MHSFSAEANLAASRSYALETQTFVIHVGPHTDAETVRLLTAGDDHAASLLRVGGGYSEIIDPNGKTIAGPLEPDSEGLVIGDCDMSQIAMARMANDPAGHYSRGDATQLVLNRTPRRAVVYRDADPMVGNDEKQAAPASSSVVGVDRLAELKDTGV